MRLFTSRYGNSRAIKKIRALPVRTSIGAPRASFHYESLPELAPHGILGLPHDPYKRAYLAKLEGLGVAVIEALCIEVGGGRDLILLCYENLLDPDEWCHRRMFADWWTEQTGEPVMELEDTQPKPKQRHSFLAHSVSKTVMEKAQRMVREEKVERVSDRFYVKGDTGTRIVSGDATVCDCPTPTEMVCSHRLAVMILDQGRLFDA